MNNSKKEVLEFAKRNGPVLPVHVSKFTNGNLLFSSAILSELVSDKELFISNAKIGGSPVYYAKGQEHKLSMLYSYLPSILKKIYDILKEKKVLRDKVIEPWQRVALRQLKDFAVPMNVTINSGAEIFWRWYLVKEEGVREKIKEILEEKKEVVKEIVKEEQKALVEKKQDVVVKEEKKKIEKVKKRETFEEVFDYFNNNKVRLVEGVKKGKEQFFIVNVPSNIGELKYFTVFRDKKRINEGDLSLAYHEARKYDLPVLFLSKGNLTKKGEKFLEELKGYVLFKKI